MKKIILIILTIITVTCTLNAQTNYSIAGTWRYVNNNDTIIMYFKPDTLHIGTEILNIHLGFHKFVKNGTLIDNTLNFSNTTYSQKKASIYMFGNEPSDAREDGHIEDYTLNNRRYIILKKINPTTINVTLNYIQGVRNNQPYGFTMPRHFTLTKQ